MNYNFPDCQNKVVLFATNDSHYTNLSILSPKLEEQGNRLFVVGTIPKYDGGYGEEKPCALAWDTVINYIIFDTEEEFLRESKKTSYDDSIGSFFSMFKKS